jgi:hypothetical protein
MYVRGVSRYIFRLVRQIFKIFSAAQKRFPEGLSRMFFRRARFMRSAAFTKAAFEFVKRFI